MVPPGIPHSSLRGGTALNGVGHGTLLAARYRLEERLSSTEHSSTWRAVDETVDHPVTVRVLRERHPQSADVVDAARRAALMEDHRLARLLDVGQDGPSTFLVSESVPGRTLADALSDGPLPAETVRRLIGEAAQALARAESRGLHHQLLLPEHLLIRADGSVLVTGIAVDAALADAECPDAARASRIDAVGLVQVLYAGLTGRWPGASRSTVLPAPRIAGRAVPPADLVPGVPNDLDTLCAVTLGPYDDGPRSPADLAGQLAPWAGIEPLTSPRGLRLGGPARPSRAAGAEGTAEGTASGQSSLLPRTADTGTTAGAPGAGAPAPARPAEQPRVSADLRAELLESNVRARQAGQAAAGMPVASAPVTSAPSAPAPSAPAPSAPAPSRAPAGTSRGASGPTTGGLALGEPPVAPPALPAPPPPQPPRPFRDTWADLAQIGTPVPEEESLVPFVAPVPVQQPPQQESRFVISVVVGFVALMLIVAAFSLRDFGSGGNARPTPSPAASTKASASSAPSPTPSSAPATTAAPSTAPGASPEVVRVQAIDPQGDGSENDAQAPRAMDGDPHTAWKSNHYATADFSGLKKGLGLVVDLRAASTVREVTVDVAGTGGRVELRTTTSGGLDGSAIVASGAIGGGQVVLTPAQPVSAGEFLLWFTRLPNTGGKYQLVVSEIGVR